MCTERRISLPWLLCALSFLLGIILPFGLCQNAGSRGKPRRMDFLRDELHADDIDQSYVWDASPEGKRPLDDDARTLSSRDAAEASATEPEVPPRADGNRDKALLLPKPAANPSPRPGLNATTTSVGRRKANGADRSRKKRRRGKDSKFSQNRQQQGGEGGDVRENEIRDKRGETVERRNGAGSRKSSRDPQARKYRAERRRRRKNRERKRGRKRTRQNEEKAERRKTQRFNKRPNDEAPAALFLGRIDKQRAPGKNDSWQTPENPSNLTSSRINHGQWDDTGGPATANLQDQLTTETNRKSAQTTLRYGNYGDTVEREFSKQLEREISRTRLEDPSSLENRILGSSLRDTAVKNANEPGETKEKYKTRPNLASSRYDATRMLGYSRTEEDLPILDLENEVLARTMKDYNAYMTSNLKLSMLPRSEDIERTKSSGSHSHGKPIIDSVDLERLDGSRKDTETTTTLATTADEDNTNGDLSCINGTFVPAPLVRHAPIKYVKSSIPGHEYLEADYECTPGYYMVSTTNRLLCRNRQWVGHVPRCKPKQNSDGVCAEAGCDHVCKDIDGRPVCSCYKGFQLEDNKCIDINECLLNNGHGPCQDTCRNTVGGYECSCDGLQDTVLSPDNHTCQDAGPCSVNNAGCSHTCLSTMGRVFCLCPDGFILEDDWKTCQDVDECVQPDLQTEVCRYGCINTPGSYRCADPTELKDQPILDSLSITCLPGYEATPDGICIDINECGVDNGGCTEVCENTDGSFFCACDGDEKALSSDGKSCVDINNVSCPPLDPAGRGYLMCSRLATPKPWRGRRRQNRPGTKCFLKCPHGYQLHGEYELSCRSDGTWDGPKHGECVRYSKPRLDCPKDVVAELPPGRDEAFVTFDQPSTDLDWFRYVRSKPSWGTRLEASLKPGVHEVAFFARHPISKKQASCMLRIIVKGGEAPKVKDCPNDIEVTGGNGTAITWVEPIFTDNVKVTRIRSNESPGRRFAVGGHRIEYEASDDAGWSSKCVFTVVLRQE